MIFVMYECEERLGYTFKDKTLLRTCFTHSSYSHEHGGKNNELLEFFGDAILEFVVTEDLFAKFPAESEGVLTGYRQQIVSRKPLAEAIVRLGLNEYILFGEGERRNPPEHHEAACENLFEALVAGIYTDGGLDEARNFIKRVLLSRFRPDKNGVKTEEIPAPITAKTENYKGKLQEYVQKNRLGEIVYREKNKTGPAHEPVFTVSVTVGDKELGVATGRKKSDAEQSAAKTAFDKLTGKPEAKTLNNAKNTANAKSGKAVKNKNREKNQQAAGSPRPDDKRAGNKQNKQAENARAKEKQTTGNKSRSDNKKSGKGKSAANPERRKIK